MPNLIPRNRKPAKEMASRLRSFLVPLHDHYGHGIVAKRKWKLADFNEGRIYRWVVYRNGIPHQVFARGDQRYKAFWVAWVEAVEAMCAAIYRVYL